MLWPAVSRREQLEAIEETESRLATMDRESHGLDRLQADIDAMPDDGDRWDGLG